MLVWACFGSPHFGVGLEPFGFVMVDTAFSTRIRCCGVGAGDIDELDGTVALLDGGSSAGYLDA